MVNLVNVVHHVKKVAFTLHCFVACAWNHQQAQLTTIGELSQTFLSKDLSLYNYRMMRMGCKRFRDTMR